MDEKEQLRVKGLKKIEEEIRLKERMNEKKEK